jgi:hypothetical protein
MAEGRLALARRESPMRRLRRGAATRGRPRRQDPMTIHQPSRGQPYILLADVPSADRHRLAAWLASRNPVTSPALSGRPTSSASRRNRGSSPCRCPSPPRGDEHPERGFSVDGREYIR